MGLRSCTVVDEGTLLDCVNQSIASVVRQLGLLAGGDVVRAEQLTVDLYCSVARVARGGPCLVPFDQLHAAARRLFVADALAVRAREATTVREAQVVDEFGQSLMVHEVNAHLPAMARMPDRERGVLVFHRVDGLTNDEIAAELGVSARRVTALLRRGLRRMGLRSVQAVQADVVAWAGPPLAPSPDLLHAVRRQVVAEWRGHSLGPAVRRRARAPRRALVGAVAAVGAVFVGVAWSGAVSVARSEPEAPIAATSTTMCPGHVTSQGLANVTFAFDGDVVTTFAGTDLTGGPVQAVTFDVRRWHRGDVRRQLTVRWRSDVRPRPGMRMLVSGGESDGVPVVWGCGYSLERTDLDAALWRSVIDPTSTGATFAAEKAAERRHDG
jgi:hypothetical protein